MRTLRLKFKKLCSSLQSPVREQGGALPAPPPHSLQLSALDALTVARMLVPWCGTHLCPVPRALKEKTRGISIYRLIKLVRM